MREHRTMRRMGEKIRRFLWSGMFVFAMLFVDIAGMQQAATVHAEESKKVRVAFPTQEGMSYIGHSGKVTGYNYDYLEKVSEYTGLNMEYIAYPSADGNEAVGSAMNDLMEGTVDLMGPMLKTEQTQELFEFPEHSYGTVYTTLCALISSVSLSPVANTRIVAQFAARPYYFVSTKGNTSLIARMDGAMEKINQAEPKLQDTLYDTYFRNIDDTFLLPETQKTALQAVGTFHVLCVDQDAPYVSQVGGQPSGMLISILEAFAENTGVQMEYTFCADRNEAETLLNRKKFELVVGAPMSSSTSAQLGLINDILDISKIESGKMTLNQLVFSLEDLVESINVVVRPMAVAKKQEFRVKMKDIPRRIPSPSLP